MQCVRCKHELSPRADRCVRCFALNPKEPRPIPVLAPRPVEHRIASDAPAAPLSLSFEDEPVVSPPKRAPRPRPTPEDSGELRVRAPIRAAARSARLPSAAQFELPISFDAEPAPVAPPALPSDPPFAEALEEAPAVLPPAQLAETLVRARPAGGSRLLAWALDAALVCGIAAGFVALSAYVVGPGRLAPHGIGSRDYWFDLLLSRRMGALWSALLVTLAVAYSWLFVTLHGRTPGMAVARLRLERRRGGPLTPLQALARALFAVPSAALGLFGFVLALLDPEGLALHDRLARAVVLGDERSC